ncbi:hypothetical protein FACS189454_01970 [Planctomycetales bacterium]|nr:hypothetical protein FACS189454_01970 [Planctomycetales bacterium]
MMKIVVRNFLFFLLGFTVATLSGCGQRGLPGMPKLYPATLTVFQDGKPLENASVVLINVDPSSTWSAGGQTDANGIVRLQTMGQFKGIPEGTYSVAVSKIEFPDFEHPGDPPYGNAKAMKKYDEALKRYEDNTFLLVDTKYAIGVSDLKVTVTKANGKVSVDVGPPVHIKAPSTPKG